jgi:hypothetical protein
MLDLLFFWWSFPRHLFEFTGHTILWAATLGRRPFMDVDQVLAALVFGTGFG